MKNITASFCICKVRNLQFFVLPKIFLISDMRFLTLFFTILFAFDIVAHNAADVGYDYERLMHRAMEMNTRDVLDLAIRADKDSDENSALVLYMVVINRSVNAKSLPALKACVVAYQRSGDIYYWKGNYAKAMSLYVKALRMSENCSGRPLAVKIYKSIGNVYCMFEDYEKAVVCYKKGLAFARQYPDKESEYRTKLNLSYVYHLKDNAKAARCYYVQSQKISHSDSPEFKFFDKFYYANVLESEDKCREAIDVLKPLAVYARDNKLPFNYECSVYEGLYKSYKKLGNSDSTMTYLKKCYDVAKRTGTLSMFTETLKEMSAIYGKRGEREKSLSLIAEYSSIIDSTFNRREFSVAKDAQFSLEMETIDKKIVAMNAEMENNRAVIRLQSVLLVTVLGVVLLVCLFFFIFRRQKFHLRESYQNLFHLNRKLRRMHERMVNEAVMRPEDDVVENCREEKRGGSKYKSSNLRDEKRDALLKKINGIMENTLAYADDSFSLDTLAELTGSNCKYVSQVINDCYGRNFNNFVNEYRIRLACDRFSDEEHFGNYTIRGIAASVGYKSNTTFVNVFRKTIGMTPSAYRAIAHEEAANDDKNGINEE